MKIVLLSLFIIGNFYNFCNAQKCSDDLDKFEHTEIGAAPPEKEVARFKKYLTANQSKLTPECLNRLHLLIGSFYEISGNDSADDHYKKAIYYAAQFKSDTSSILAMLAYSRFLNNNNKKVDFSKYMDSIYYQLFQGSKKYKYHTFLGSNNFLSDTGYIIKKNVENLDPNLINDMPNNIKYLWIQYYLLRGSALIFSTQIELAKKYIKLSLFFDKTNLVDNWEATSYNNLAMLYQNDGNHAVAVEYFQESLNQNEIEKEELSMVNTLGNISYSYKAIGQYKKAKEFTTRGIQIAEKLGMKKNLCRTLSAHASIFIEEKDYNEAEKFLHKSIELSRSINNKADMCYSMRKLANMLIAHTPRLEEGKLYIDSSASYCNEIGDTSFLYFIGYTRANYYYKKNNYNKALELATDSYEKSIEYNDKEVMLPAAQLLCQIYEKQNNPTKALEYYKKYAALRDNTTGKEMQLALTEMQEKYDSQAKVLTIQKLEKQQQEKARQTKILFSVAGGMLLLIGAFFYFNRKLKKQKKTLQTTNERLDELTASQNRLFGIISHDLKGMIVPFQRAGKILTNHIGKGNLDDAKLFSEKLEENASRLSMTLNNLLFWSLQQMKGVKINKEILPIFETIEHVASHYADVIKVKNIDIVIDIPKEETFFTDKEAFQIIVRNLLSNAIKFTENNPIQFTTINTPTHYKVTIKDKGIGMSETQITKLFAFDDKKVSTGTQGEIGSGLGLIVVKKMTEVLNGKLDIQSQLGAGTTISIIFEKN
jgi:signal transduction histidine kinase